MANVSSFNATSTPAHSASANWFALGGASNTRPRIVVSSPIGLPVCVCASMPVSAVEADALRRWHRQWLATRKARLLAEIEQLERNWSDE